ncbi:efflux RND transporter periplasmic adaptor subunit [Caulifigura coniformis]|uniref:efflux RND transporter periplasmic adaptor subunit n=1 Tax=Caulifigura coniformis TaxID=2527983 RepID=UPI0018D20177|nr:efflux RND transporter periplasmic adaptor subunit [Caulifigura coniformis]
MNRTFALVLGVLSFFVVAPAGAHEGHAPLLTRGASIDPATGVLRLSREARSILDVMTEEVTERKVEGHWFAYAAIESPWTGSAFVSPLLAGRIVKLHVQPGENVKSGQLLAELDSQELQQLRQELLTAKNAADLASDTAKRLDSAANAGAVAGQQLLEAQNQAAQAANALSVARRKWLALGLEESRLDGVLSGVDQQPVYMPIMAPIEGVANHADLSVGKIVAPQEHIFEIADLRTLWLRIRILEKDFDRIQIGQVLSFTLSAHPGKSWLATVDKLGAALDPETHLADAWATVTNPMPDDIRLMPGMRGQVQISQTNTVSRVAVPTAAVFRDGAERFVLVEQTSTKESSEYKKQSIVTGQQSGGFIELRGGKLYPGDRVVTQGGHELAVFFTKGSLRLNEETAKDIGLSLASVSGRLIEDVFDADGAVDVPTDRRFIASSPLNGVIERIRIDRSHAVRKGDVIAEVKSLEFHNLQLELLGATLDQQLQSTVLEKLKLSGDSIARRRFLDVEAAERDAAFRIEGTRRRLAALGVTEEELRKIQTDSQLMPTLPLRALIDGTVVTFTKVLGQVVRPEEPLFEIHDLSKSFVEAFVAERDSGRVQVGQPVRIRLVSDPEAVLTGRVIRLGHTVGTASRTLSAWIEVEGDGMQQRPHNSLARVTFKAGESPARTTVPLSALLQEGNRRFVFVKGGDGTFARRPISVGRKDDRFAEITHGLAGGETVAVRGVFQLQTGYAAIR